MPDILIDGLISTTFDRRGYSRHVVGVDQNTHYVFYIDSSEDLVSSKSTDGGSTWTLPTSVHAGTIVKFQVWYDRWNPDDTATLIHIILLDSAGPSLSYYSLDTSDDAVSVEVEIEAPVISGTLYSSNQATIAKARGGNLLVQFWGDGAGSHGCWRSIDGGISWVARADGADGNSVDYVMMVPGNETDNQDMWMLYLDRTANELTLKTYDDSGDSWSEDLISTGITESIAEWQFAASVRHGDNHLLLATWTIIDDPLADLLTFDINGGGSITPMGNVVTDSAESGNACLTINQQNDDVYVGYNKGGVWGSTVDTVFKLSSDGMSTWGAEQVMSEDAADDYLTLSSTLSIGDAGGKFLPVWNNDDLRDLLCNVNNAVSIDPVAPPIDPGLPEYGQGRAAIGDPSVYGATIVRS